MALAAQVVQLSEVPLDRATQAVRDRATLKTGGQATTGFPDYEWSRVAYMLRRLPRQGGRYLQVGVERGYLCALVARFRKYDAVVAADTAPRRALPARVEFHETSLEKLDFPDASFSNIVCSGVLEHLDDEALTAGLANLRRMAGGQLLITVPFNAPESLANAKQSFSQARIKDLFPGAKYSLLLKEPVTRVPWLLIEERHGAVSTSSATVG